jgi:hypothetical protein
VSGATVEKNNQPLLADTFYLERALQPFSEVRQGDIAQLLQREIAVLILADVGQLAESERTALDNWIKRGGVVVRFAGPRLAEADDLVHRVGARAQAALVSPTVQKGKNRDGGLAGADAERAGPLGPVHFVCGKRKQVDGGRR